MSNPTTHGLVRGADSPRRSRLFEGRFGRMFRSLPSADFAMTEASGQIVAAEAVLHALAEEMKSDAPKESRIPAGYTYLGQFIDHDITFDPVSSLQRANDPESLVNYRTPRLDLDCVYGRGPLDQPYLYQDDGVRMLLGENFDGQKGIDVPRMFRELSNLATSGEKRFTDRQQITDRAVIGDPRNDENVIISQLHALFLRFHNQVAGVLSSRRPGQPEFAEVQRIVRWHYQWLILMDFLPRIINKTTYNEVLPHATERGQKANRFRDPQLRFYHPRYEAFIPIEFSAAAYRFGHSMVRPSYKINRGGLGVGGPFDIVKFGEPTDDSRGDLRGFRRFRRDWVVEWDLFFEDVSDAPASDVQRAFRIDTSLAGPLAELPSTLASGTSSLAERNLLRGFNMGLPSGQAVAHAMGVDPIPERLLPLAVQANTPLWYYILAEAAHECAGEQLGPVGGRIVMETLVGLLLEDGHSFLQQCPLWTPEKFDAFQNDDGNFCMTEFVRAALNQPPT